MPFRFESGKGQTGTHKFHSFNGITNRRSPYSEAGEHNQKILAPIALRHHFSKVLPLSYDLCNILIL